MKIQRRSLPTAARPWRAQRADELASFGLAIESFGPGAVAVRETPSLLGKTNAQPKILARRGRREPSGMRIIEEVVQPHLARRAHDEVFGEEAFQKIVRDPVTPVISNRSETRASWSPPLSPLRSACSRNRGPPQGVEAVLTAETKPPTRKLPIPPTIAAGDPITGESSTMPSGPASTTRRDRASDRHVNARTRGRS